MHNCFECEVFKKHERRKRLNKLFTWHVFPDEKPVEECIEYVVLIAGAKTPTILIWDGCNFVDDLNDPYPVKYWGKMPELPEELV